MKVQLTTPILEKPEPKTVQCIMRDMKSSKHECVWAIEYGNSLISRCRNRIAEEIIKTDFDYLFFIDGDMVWQTNLVDLLIGRDKDIIGCVYPVKYGGYHPAYRSLIVQQRAQEQGSFDNLAKLIEFPKGLEEVQYISAGIMMIKVSCLKEMFKHYKFPFMPMEGINSDYLSEDYAFCQRAKDKGFQIWADGTVDVGHVGKTIFTRFNWEKGRI